MVEDLAGRHGPPPAAPHWPEIGRTSVVGLGNNQGKYSTGGSATMARSRKARAGGGGLCAVLGHEDLRSPV